jgi:hypothetical protein
MNVPAIARTSALLVTVALMLGACQLVPAARPAPASEPRAPSAAAPAATEPAPLATNPVIANEATLAKRTGPPGGLLSSGQTTVEGKLGSYCYGSICADIARWPPKSDLPHLVANGKMLTFALSNDEPFVLWRASYAGKSDGDPTGLGHDGQSFDPDANPSASDEFMSATFDVPPAGDWVVWLSVGLAPGDLSFAWHVTVLPDTATE